MCEEGWCVRLGQEGFVWGWGGGTVWNTLKGGGTKKRGRETKIFKKGGNLGEEVGTLKWGRGAGTPFQLCHLVINTQLQIMN